MELLEEKSDQDNIDPKLLRLAYFALFEIIEEQFKGDREYTLTARCVWKNIKETLFKEIYKDNHNIERLLDHALNLYLQTKP
ncbi:MAG: hypothetical protein D3910_27785 [Candidatus Electrothrix sp. ATG2]|nr:hypothetical protein [Candidatus Electrothrix sp. ATG2]